MPKPVYDITESDDPKGACCFVDQSGRALVVSKRQTASAVRRALSTHRLAYSGKVLISDCFTHFWPRLTLQGARATLAFVSEKRVYDFDAIEALFDGNPPLFIADGFLYFLNAPIEQALVALHNRELSSEERTKALREYEEDDDVEVIAQGSVPKLPAQPALVLSDPKGCFANLYFVRGDARSLYEPYLTRDEEEIAFEKDLLETAYQRKRVDSSQYYCPVNMVGESLRFLVEIGWHIEDYRGRELVLQGKSALSLERSEGALLLRGHLRFGEQSIPVGEIEGSFARERAFVDLSASHVGLVDWKEVPTALSEAEPIERSAALRKYRFSDIGLFTESEGAQTGFFEGVRNNLAPPEAPSEHFDGTLYPYQNEGMAFLAFLYENGVGGLVADEMGLGKTVQMLAFLSLYMDKRALIVAPSSLLGNWHRECRRFLPRATVALYSGAARSMPPDAPGVVITSYALLRYDAAIFADERFDIAVFDEAQAIKNPAAQVSRAAQKIRAPCTIGLTGTPVENSIGDLYGIFSAVFPEVLTGYSYTELLRMASSDRALTQFLRKVRPFILRRQKSDVALQLPEKVERTVYVSMEESQRAVYERLLQKAKGALSSGKTFHVFEAILRLRQICCAPSLVEGSYDGANAKLEVLLDDLDEVVASGKKALVYSQFTGVLQTIRQKIPYPTLYLDGQTKNRDEVIDAFQTGECAILLMSLKAGGVGLNITAADYVLLYDPWWNEALEAQAIGRAHRVGRRDRVFAKRYVTLETIEEKIMKKKDIKKELFNAALSATSESASSFSLDEYKELLE